MKRRSHTPGLARALAGELVQAGTRATESALACNRTLSVVRDLRRDRDHMLEYMGHRTQVVVNARDRAADRPLALASALANARDRERTRDVVGALTGAHIRARELARELCRLTNLTNSLAEMLALGLASGSDYALANVRALSSNHVLARFGVLPSGIADASRRVRVLVSDEVRASALDSFGRLDLIRVLDQNLRLHLDVILDSARRGYSKSDFVWMVDRALDLNLDLDRIIGSFVGIDRVLDCARDLKSALDVEHAAYLASTAVHSLQTAVSEVEVAVPDSANPMPGPVPRGLVALATQMLPAPQRPRYRAEFRVELVELPRQERLAYARRVLAGAWELRRVLVEAARDTESAVARGADG